MLRTTTVFALLMLPWLLAGSGSAGHTETIEVSYDGVTDAQLCPLVTCIGITDGTHIEEPHAAPGTPTRFHAVATWDADTLLTQSLGFFLIVETENGGRSWDPDSTVFRGPSPQTIEWDLTPYEGKQTWMRVTSLRFFYALPEEFHIEGTLDYMPVHA